MKIRVMIESDEQTGWQPYPHICLFDYGYPVDELTNRQQYLDEVASTIVKFIKDKFRQIPPRVGNAQPSNQTE